MKYQVLLILLISNLVFSNDLVLKPSSSSHDFGDVVQNTVNEWNVKLFNKTGKVIEIQKVYATCGCTKTKIDKLKVLPNGYSVLNVIFESGKFVGKQHKYVFVEQKNGKKITILLYANVLRELSVEPYFIRLNENENLLNKKVNLVNNTKKNISIKNVFCKSECVNLKNIGNKSFDLTITRRSGCEGEININILLSNGKTIYSKLLIEKKSKYRLSPKRLVFLNLRRNIERKLEFSIKSLENFELLKVIPKEEWIKVISQEEQKDGYKILFSVIIKNKMKKNNGFTTIELQLTNSKNKNEVVSIPVTYSIIN